HVRVHQQHIAAARHGIRDVMNREDAAELKIHVEHDLRARTPTQPVELFFHQFVPKSQSQHDVLYACVLEHSQMALQERHPAETQQALGQLGVLGQLQTNASPCR